MERLNPQPKHKRVRNAGFRKHTNSKRCLACQYGIHGLPTTWGDLNPAQASHASFRNDKGTSLKSSDLFVTPLCQYHHRIRESMGTRNFWGKHLFPMLLLMYANIYEYFGKRREAVNDVLIEGLREINDRQ